MGRVVIFGGTSEGRHLAEFCVRQGIPAAVSVVSDYGKSLLPESPDLTVVEKALSEEEMIEWLKEEKPELVVDATHPYADKATGYIKKNCGLLGIQRIRVVRTESSLAGEDIVVKDSMEEAAAYLAGQEGKILLTTGTKDLDAFTVIPDYEERVFARVLPSLKSLEKCLSLSIKGRHIIAMEGPFSRDMNQAMLKQLGARFLVTKESGAAGGFEEKVEGARAAGAQVVVIGRPKDEEGISEEEAKKILLSCRKDGRRKLFLIGTGMGGPGQMTGQAKDALRQCQAIFGSERAAKEAAEEAPDASVIKEYQPEKILSWLEDHPQTTRCAAVYSGDTGFYSGAQGLLKALEEKNNGQWETEVIPGISSLSYLAARLKKSWQNVFWASSHGRQVQIGSLLDQLASHPAVFLLTEGKESVNCICREIEKEEQKRKAKYRVYTGEDLSYENERIRAGRPGELAGEEFSRLAALWIEKEEGE